LSADGIGLEALSTSICTCIPASWTACSSPCRDRMRANLSSALCPHPPATTSPRSRAACTNALASYSSGSAVIGSNRSRATTSTTVGLLGSRRRCCWSARATSIRGVGLLGEEAGQRLVPAQPLGVPADLKDKYLSGGFDLQATRRVAAADRAGLEKMCRYILHPPFSHDRLQLTDDGRVRVQFTRPWSNGVDSVTLSPLNFIARLVPLVPRPGVHQLTYNGVLAARDWVTLCLLWSSARKF
jgi:hypothetical protein